MAVAVVFVILAIGFLGLIVLPKLRFSPASPDKKPKPAESTTDPDPAFVRGDDLAIWPFVPMPIMTDTEVIFFHKLKRALPDYHIFVQVQLSRLIEANSDEASERRFWFNRICRQSVDFVIVDMDAQTSLVAIELDDWTHNSKSRQKADDKKDKALASAGIPIVRYHAERMPSAELLQEELMTVIETY